LATHKFFITNSHHRDNIQQDLREVKDMPFWDGMKKKVESRNAKPESRDTKTTPPPIKAPQPPKKDLGPMEIIKELKEDSCFKDGKYFRWYGCSKDSIKLISQLRKLSIEAMDKFDKMMIENKIVTLASLDSDENSITNLINSNDSTSKYTDDHPILIAQTGSIIYYYKSFVERDSSWKIQIPLGLNCRLVREIVIKDLSQTDKFVKHILQEYPNWQITTSSSQLSNLINRKDIKEISTWENPITIGDIAYLFYSKSDDAWDLRIPDGIGDQRFIVREPPQGMLIADAILDTIASVGLGLMNRR
jgi:hypothetical protein